MNKAGNFFIRLVKGVVIGIAAILPGASGGVLAVAMGVYRPVLDAVTSLFRNFTKSVRFLIPLGLGGLIGLLGTSRIVEWLMLNCRREVMWALIGMVLGGLPSLIREANERGFKKRYLLGALVGAALIGSVAIAQEFLGNGEALPFNAWTAALSGALIGLGMVIPGVSTSFIMIYLGVYDPFLAAFNRFELDMLVFAGLGALAAVVSLVALVKRLFDRRHGYAYYGALGLLAVSVVLIFPGFGRGWEIALDASLFAACFAGTFFLCRLSGEPSVAEDLLGAAKPADPGEKRPG
ncbi:MAG: hypothetical protein BWY35_02011 [Firmicutes bacterium ADurb.Bin248]|nr:MAG: hypothetical protein BWY35_02011 [Firmicutes bacterium ADurb.Bin248]HPK16908.1 DUF368 domain-containing protein [Clostridia bacterium]